MNRLKTFRKLNKLTQQELAKVLGTTREQFYLYETGKRELRESQIVTICKHFNVSADYLLGISDNPDV